LQIGHVDIADRSVDTDDPIIPVSASISGSTGSEQSFCTAFKWLETCVKEHGTLCPKLTTSHDDPKLPHRVVDVTRRGSQDVRLVETEGSLGQYACLSHCWGGEQPLVTTLEPDTLSQYKRYIKWDILPRTFRDAIVVTRRLGIQYLWIDSLCIIQDSLDDWRVQSALMAEIYQNSIITLAGSASSGPHKGLFRIADPVHVDQSLPISTTHEGVDNIRCRTVLSHNATELPLLQRGWVFQERLLSPRYLHFSQHELIWECMEHISCECGSLRLKDSYRHKWLEHKNRLHPDSLPHLQRLPNMLSSSWQAAVADYSRMELSYPKDIFPAISGIAKSVKEATGWKYAAGMWKETFITDLVWRTEKPSRAVRCKDWRAPTFSWGSIIDIGPEKRENKSYISYAFMSILSKGLDESIKTCKTDLYATVVETSCKPLGKDLTGQLESGFIILRGTLVEATLCHTPNRDAGQWQIAPIGKEPLSNSLFHPDINFHLADYKLQDRSRVYCLKLIGLSQSRDTLNGEYLLYLVLRKVDDCGLSRSDAFEGSTFERIALLRDARGDAEYRLESGTQEEAIQRETLVKIL
jgi:hypothetical protein